MEVFRGILGEGVTIERADRMVDDDVNMNNTSDILLRLCANTTRVRVLREE